VFHDAELIATGDYFFASSHDPAYRLQVPPGTYTVTILRDPLSRVISYYSYLLWARANPRAYETEPFVDRLLREGRFLDGRLPYFRQQLSRSRGESPIRALGLGRRKPRGIDKTFANFLMLVPSRHLMAQLHMFSAHMDPGEAAERALSCSTVSFTETFSEDLKRLGSRLGLDLVERKEKTFVKRVELTPQELELLRARLKPEYEMINRVREGLGRRPLVPSPLPTVLKS
jgi:hypothetical protein